MRKETKNLFTLVVLVMGAAHAMNLDDNEEVDWTVVPADDRDADPQPAHDDYLLSDKRIIDVEQADRSRPHVPDFVSENNTDLFDAEDLKPLRAEEERATTDCNCGISNNNPSGRIVGGGEVNPQHAYPFQVYVQSCTGSGCGLCGGTLLNRLFVMTAAHCIMDRNQNLATNVVVGLGMHFRSESGGNVQRIRVSRIITNNYIPSSLTNDIALLQLSTPAAFNNDVRPACLPTDPNRLYTNYQAVVSGWGAISETGSGSSVLKSTTIRVVAQSDPTCTIYGNLPMSKLCAYTAGTGSCYGDSGGPLFVNEDGRYTVIGVVSGAANCYYRGTAAIFTRVTAFLSWINANIASGACGTSNPTTPAPTTTTTTAPSTGQGRACDLTCTNVATLTGRYYLNGILSECRTGICTAVDGSDLCSRLGFNCGKRWCDLSCALGAIQGRYYINGILSTCQSGFCYAENGSDLCSTFGNPCGASG